MRRLEILPKLQQLLQEPNRATLRNQPPSKPATAERVI